MPQSSLLALSALSDAYLNLLKGCLTRYCIPDHYWPIHRPSVNHPIARFLYPILYPPLAAVLKRFGFILCRDGKFNPEIRAIGHDCPPEADTMMGLKRLDNLHWCIEHVINNNIAGDFIETGVWRGGGCIFMRAALNVYNDPGRVVWVADSFEGLPKPDIRYKEDRGDTFWTQNEVLAVALEDVKANFKRYNLLDDRVRFLKGWFKDTLPIAPIEQLAILRLDGDMYSSTMDALVYLYPKLSLGGFVIVDDFGANFDACRIAVTNFRVGNNITSPLVKIDWAGVYWQK